MTHFLFSSEKNTTDGEKNKGGKEKRKRIIIEEAVTDNK